MRCKDCKFWERIDNKFGYCDAGIFSESPSSEMYDDHVQIGIGEDVAVGAYFGCVHWVAKVNES